MFQRMYNQEFNESKVAFMERIGKTDIEKISFEDREFLKMMDKNSRKVGKYYELPSPLRNLATNLPNNRYLAEKRLLSLKKRFLKHPGFFLDYKIFVKELIDKGYASKSNKEAPEGRTWYIPHHGYTIPTSHGMKLCQTTTSKIGINRKENYSCWKNWK